MGETDAFDSEYEELVQRIRKAVSNCLPEAAAVAVVSRGDDELLVLGDRRTWHFPQSDAGVYAGQYPADSAEAITHIESLRRAGATHLLFPTTALWWLDHYRAFRNQLEEWDKHPLRLDGCCVTFRLKEH